MIAHILDYDQTDSRNHMLNFFLLIISDSLTNVSCDFSVFVVPKDVLVDKGQYDHDV